MEHHQKYQGFLEDFYLRAFDKERFDSFVPVAINPTTQEIIKRYQDIIKEYSVADLEKEGVIPEQLWQALKEIGLFGLNVPEAYGGVGLSLPQYLKVLEALAHTDLSLTIIPTAHLSIGIKGILLFGNEDQKKRYLPKAASGEMIFAYALTEPQTGSDAQHIETRAELSGDGRYYVLNGQKTYITNGGYAGGLTVFAQMDPERPGFMGAFIVETAWEGVQVGKDMPKMGLALSSTTALSFKDVRVPVENLLGDPGDGFKVAMTVLNYGRLGLGAASVGMMEQSIADMLKRASNRKQFGVPIKEFELVQEKVVRAKVHCAVTSAMTHFTAHLLDHDPLANLAIESSHTKLFGTTRAWDTLYDALQVAGGSGYIATQPYEKRMRDFRVTTIFEGTTEIHSIYPPLHLFRTLQKEIKALGKSRMKQFFFLLNKLIKSPALPLSYDDQTLQEAVHEVRQNVKAIRKLLYQGLMRHGKEVVKREFFLRRITSLSLYIYGIICLLAQLGAEQQQGKKVSGQIRLLGYFVEEAKASRKKNSRFSGGEKERLHHEIFRDLISS